MKNEEVKEQQNIHIMNQSSPLRNKMKRRSHKKYIRDHEMKKKKKKNQCKKCLSR